MQSELFTIAHQSPFLHRNNNSSASTEAMNIGEGKRCEDTLSDFYKATTIDTLTNHYLAYTPPLHQGQKYL